MQCPLLCKEFIVDAWQLYYARSKGADAVLLIAAVLPDRDINYMLKICKILGMAALVEVSWAALVICYICCFNCHLMLLSCHLIYWFNWTVLLKVHDEREMDRVLGINGVQLIGINNRNLGMFFYPDSIPSDPRQIV